jgi:putative intracellular protease/amidase
MASPKILMVVTSHGDVDDIPTTGIWFTEFSEPFEAFVKMGARISVASPRGGPAPRRNARYGRGAR